MKAFVRRICRVFLIIGITGLLTLIGGAATLLGHSSTAYADGCRYHPVRVNYQPSCLPNGAYCPQGLVWQTETNSCVAPNPSMCNYGITKQNPDNYDQCIPESQPYGTADTVASTYYDSALPNGAYCPQGLVWQTETNSCVAPNPSMCNYGITKQNPDNYDQCIPESQP